MNLRDRVLKVSDYLDERYHPRSYQLFMIAIFAGLLLFGFFSSVSSGQANLFGYTIPPLCPFKRITTLDCPGCGMTRAFIMALHLRFQESYFLHIWGIPMTLFVLMQPPYRIWRMISGKPIKLDFPSRSTKWLKFGVIVSVFIPWIVKTGHAISGMLR